MFLFQILQLGIWLPVDLGNVVNSGMDESDVSCHCIWLAWAGLYHHLKQTQAQWMPILIFSLDLNLLWSRSSICNFVSKYKDSLSLVWVDKQYVFLLDYVCIMQKWLLADILPVIRQMMCSLCLFSLVFWSPVLGPQKDCNWTRLDHGLVFFLVQSFNIWELKTEKKPVHMNQLRWVKTILSQ